MSAVAQYTRAARFAGTTLLSEEAAFEEKGNLVIVWDSKSEGCWFDSQPGHCVIESFPQLGVKSLCDMAL